jgi:hypothetical protein
MATGNPTAGPKSFLTYRNFRYLKVMLLGLVACAAVYWWFEPVGGRNGGTWTGWGLGSVAGLLMLWLLYFGVRKRAYFSTSADLQGWLSAHVYLGIGLIGVVLLHNGFQFAWNFHNVAFLLVFLVVLSGIIGIVTYSSVPGQMTRNRRGERIDFLYEQVADLNTEISSVALGLPDFYAKAAEISINETQIGGSWIRQFSGHDPSCGTGRAIKMIQEHHAELDDEQRSNIGRLVELLGRKAALLQRIRNDVRFKAIMDVWLFFHVPLSVASVVAVITHIIIVFYYR